MISVVTPTYNEIDNIENLYNEIKIIFQELKIDYEHIIIDNNSNDGTIDKIKELASKDKKLKIIINKKNYGHIRSPYYGLLQSTGDATILMASDFQDPPDLIKKFIKEWENGYKIVLAQKSKVNENFLLRKIRRYYYQLLKKISDTELTVNTTGTGLYDKEIINILKKINDPYPYFRGLVLSFGFDYKLIQFEQPKRKYGNTKNNFFTLVDIGLLGLIKQSILPIRLMTIIGFFSSFAFALIAVGYLLAKIFFWNNFQAGFAPILIGLFFIGSIIIMMLGIIGEYLKTLIEYNKKENLLLEKERINFE